MKLVCISDTHSMHRRIQVIPDGDVLVHAGDSLGQGTLDNIEELNDWLGTLPHRYKIVIAGNHDWAFQETPELAQQALTNAIHLEDSGIEIEGVRFWGSPWTPTFMDWAFMLDRGEPLQRKWQLIPDNVDVLVTYRLRCISEKQIWDSSGEQNLMTIHEASVGGGVEPLNYLCWEGVNLIQGWAGSGKVARNHLQIGWRLAHAC
ncbi:MAG: putative phosphoesterase [Marinobacter excellens HL-55]|uniref:Putative phosphoesterase n=1 Tax=Marinobacter excellens HL-55 TaxID=1305731 RepID=A0A0P8CYA9_9GAMM|nr:MAG: putative phosphoesterase [Marinobacter excellens HL-55]